MRWGIWQIVTVLALLLFLFSGPLWKAFQFIRRVRSALKGQPVDGQKDGEENQDEGAGRTSRRSRRKRLSSTGDDSVEDAEVIEIKAR